MSYLLKRILVGVCIALVMMLVHKVSHAATVWYANSGNYSGYTAKAACSAISAAVNTSGGVVSSTPFATDATQAYCMYSKNGTSSTFATVFKDNDGLTTCSGGATYFPSDQSCRVPVPCTAGGETSPNSHYATLLMQPAGQKMRVPTIDGCGIVLDTVTGKGYSDSSGNYYHPVGFHYNGLGNYTGPDGTAPGSGNPIAPDAVPDAPPGGPTVPYKAPSSNSDNSCPAGTQNIGTDSTGTAMCQGSGTGTSPTKQTDTAAPPVTATNPDGSTTTTNTKTATNSDGSKDTTTTQCTTDTSGGESCITSKSTGTNTAGAPGKSDGTGSGSSPDDLCTKHPELNVCANSQVSGNNCSGGVSNIAWSGDAIQGAILKRVADEQCANQQDTPYGKLGTDLLGGNDPLQSQINTAMTGTTVDLSANKLNQDGFLGGGAGFVDQAVSVNGRSLLIPFSKINQVEPLKYAVLLCAFIAAYLLCSKSIIQGV